MVVAAATVVHLVAKVVAKGAVVETVAMVQRKVT